MKRLLQIIFFLIATKAVAQADFSNGYVITVSGFMDPNNDPNVGDCNSGYYLNIVYENDEQRALTPYMQVGGESPSFFTGSIDFLSTKKIKGIFIHAKNENKKFDLKGWYCRGDETETIFPISLVNDYPCGERTIQFDIANYKGQITFNIQPLSNSTVKLNVSAQLANDANEGVMVPIPDTDFCFGTSPVYTTDYKSNYVYSLSATFNDNTSSVLVDGSTPIFYARDVLSNQNSSWNSQGKYPVLLTLTTSGGVSNYYIDGDGVIVPCASGEVQVTTLNPFVIKNPSLAIDTTFGFTLYNAAGASTVKVSIDSYGFPIKCTTGILPSDTSNRVTLVGPSPNLPSFYHWVYSTDGFSWIDLPAKFQGQHRIQLSGYDLLGDAFIAYHNRNLFFKIVVDCNGGESETLTLSGRLSAPNIVSVMPMPDRCFAVQRDGAFKITFSRPLFVPTSGTKEQLIISVRDLSNANPPEQILDVVLDGTNSLTWPRRLQSDKEYEISLIGKLQGAATYTDNVVNHYAMVKLVRPKPVSSTLTASAVHCYGGGDGEINLVARGGVGNYKFEYLKIGTGDTLRFSFGVDTTYLKNFLYAGNYLMDVRDGNNCGDQAGIKNIRVNQPDDSLHIAYSLPVNPRAYGYTDGYIETILIGGTPNADKSYTTQWYDPVNLLPSSLYTNAALSQGYQTNLDSVGDGYYILRAYDSQYAVANINHRTGCTVVSDTFHLIQPAPLMVTVREHHFINCHGYDNGEIAAHAQGGIQLQNGLPYTFEWLKEVAGVPQPIQQGDSIATQLRTGIYRVRITDKNNINKLSAPFLLVEPGVLKSLVTTTPVSCSLGTDGTARASVGGGTLPYRYEWSMGESTAPTLTQIIEGTYFVFVTDSRGCTTTASAKVDTPYPLKIDSIIRQPQCFGYTNGAVDIRVQDGTPPYSFEWSNGAVTEDVEGLGKGSYRVLIIDKNNCRSYREYKLEDPKQVTINLGGLRYLCNDQRYTASAALEDGGTQYVWSGPNGFTASTATVSIDKEGTYHVDVTDSQGCKAKDDLTIKRIGIEINSEFIVTTQAFAEQEVTLLNISSPTPDSVQWLMDENAGVRFSVKQANKAVLVFEADGTYTLYLKTYRQGCEETSFKTINVLGKSIEENVTLKSPFIEKFSVAPNPSEGVFTVRVGLQEVSSIRLRLISVASNVTVSDRTEQGGSQYELVYALNLAAGTYMLLLESPKGNSLLKIVIY